MTQWRRQRNLSVDDPPLDAPQPCPICDYEDDEDGED